MNKVDGIYELEHLALVSAITNLRPYYYGRSTLSGYFPIGALSKAVHEMVDKYGQDYISDEEFFGDDEEFVR